MLRRVARPISAAIRSQVHTRRVYDNICRASFHYQSASRMPPTHPSLTPVNTEKAPPAVGPYSQAIKVGDLVFISGCVPLDPESGEVVPGGIVPETYQALANLKAVVEASGSSVGQIIKTTVFLQSMDDFTVVNGIYSEFFGEHKPARSAVQVAKLPKGVQFEIEAIASLK